MSLHYYEELAMTEIAQVLDIKEDKAEEIRVTTLEKLLKP
jgi:DNA-directed RNA polymerase specialized sigma24 family protein